MLQKGAIAVNDTMCQENVAAIYARFSGLEGIYPEASVNSVSVQDMKSTNVSFPLGIPGDLVLPGSKGHPREHLPLDSAGLVSRDICLGPTITNKFELLEAIRKFSPVGPGADAPYAVLIQDGGNLTIFDFNG